MTIFLIIFFYDQRYQESAGGRILGVSSAFPSLEIIEHWTLSRHDLLEMLMMYNRCA